jgi:cell division protein FtsN
MADNHFDTGEPELTADDAVKQRLLGRIAVAGVVIVGLLGSLAMFDALYAPKPITPSTVATVTPPVATEPTAEPTPAPAIEPPPVTDPLATDAKATPEVTTAGPAEPLPPLPNERLTPPANAKQALAHPPGAADLQKELQREAAQAQSPKAGATAAKPSSLDRPINRPITEQAQGKVPKASGPLTALMPPDNSAKQFALQLGVFSNFANAEELRGKLEAAGIPTTVEARVRAGPFATRGEADNARAKLRALGIDESIMVSVKR